ISQNKFYDLVGELTNTYREEYELSTGGSEGVVLRGFLHGYVRGLGGMYPYCLKLNPYPSSPTPALADSRVLGGNTHKQAKAAMLSCIEDLYNKLGEKPTDKDFRLITMIQDVGSGKTHLALHIRGLPELATNTVTSYVDLSRVSPRDIYNTYECILSGFSNEDVITMREAIISLLAFKAEKNVG